MIVYIRDISLFPWKAGIWLWEFSVPTKKKSDGGEDNLKHTVLVQWQLSHRTLFKNAVPLEYDKPIAFLALLFKTQNPSTQEMRHSQIKGHSFSSAVLQRKASWVAVSQMNRWPGVMNFKFLNEWNNNISKTNLIRIIGCTQVTFLHEKIQFTKKSMTQTHELAKPCQWTRIQQLYPECQDLVMIPEVEEYNYYFYVPLIPKGDWCFRKINTLLHSILKEKRPMCNRAYLHGKNLVEFKQYKINLL